MDMHVRDGDEDACSGEGEDEVAKVRVRAGTRMRVGAARKGPSSGLRFVALRCCSGRFVAGRGAQLLARPWMKQMCSASIAAHAYLAKASLNVIGRVHVVDSLALDHVSLVIVEQRRGHRTRW